jgi:hypothetical protein
MTSSGGDIFRITNKCALPTPGQVNVVVGEVTSAKYTVLEAAAKIHAGNAA